MPELIQLLKGKSMIRYFPPKATAGFATFFCQYTQSAALTAGQKHSYHFFLNHAITSCCSYGNYSSVCCFARHWTVTGYDYLIITHFYLLVNIIYNFCFSFFVFFMIFAHVFLLSLYFHRYIIRHFLYIQCRFFVIFLSTKRSPFHFKAQGV